MIDVYWHRGDNYWDTALPRELIERATDGECNHIISRADPSLVVGRRIIIVIPGRHSCYDYEELNAIAARFGMVIFMIIGDEEGIFHSDRLAHPSMKIYWFMPPFCIKQKVDRVFPNGYPVDGPKMIKAHGNLPRTFDWSFFGQLTHIRRVMCVDAVQGIPNGNLLCTPGFTQGVSRERYYEVMLRSKLILCPSGPCTPDSFRFAEALEAGCVPIVDELTQHADYPPGYWNYVFAREGPLPFPLIRDWRTLPDVVELYLIDWKNRAEECKLWWTHQKMRMYLDLAGDLE